MTAPARMNMAGNDLASFLSSHKPLDSILSEGLASLLAEKGEEGWEENAVFMRRCGISPFGNALKPFLEHSLAKRHLVSLPSQLSDRKMQRFWFATEKAASRARKLVIK